MEDVEQVRLAGLPTIAVNSSWEIAPFADVVYAGDLKWWEMYRHRVPTTAARWTCHERAATEFGLFHQKAFGPYNSGTRALELAADFGAARILMLGYDCGFSKGRMHWHQDHPKPLGNPTRPRVQVWGVQFARVAQLLKRRGVEIVNCSRATTLTCFRRASLLEELQRRAAA